MTRYEYCVITWDESEDVAGLEATLNALGADGWEAVGMSPRGASVPMAGMGARAVPEIVVLLKRAATS